MTITFDAWVIPTVITVCGLAYAIFVYDDGDWLGSGIGNVLMLIPVLFISLISWVIYAVFK